MELIERTKEKGKILHTVLTLIGTMLCIILMPILIINTILIFKSYTDTEEVPKFGGYSPLIVLTGSMKPTINSGDLIIVKQIDPDDIDVGDIVAFFDPDSLSNAILTHRITEVIKDNGTTSFKTKGDANDTEDTSLVPSDSLVGVYVTKIQGLGNVATFMQTTSGMIICIAIPLVLFLGYDIVRQKRFEKHTKEDTETLLAELENLRKQKTDSDIY